MSFLDASELVFAFAFTSVASRDLPCNKTTKINETILNDGNVIMPICNMKKVIQDFFDPILYFRFDFPIEVEIKSN